MRLSGPSVLAGFALVAAAAGAWISLNQPYRGFQGDLYVRLERGSGASGIARTLEQTGVIRYAWQLWLERIFRPRAKLQAGEYRFDTPASAREVFDRLARGDVYYIELTVPEGSNMFDIARALETSGAMTAGEFLQAASDATPIRDLSPQAKSLEGFLFPATYRLSHETTAAALCRQMTDQFRARWKKLAAGKALDAARIVTLASLVEKETGVASERPLVAGVFVNRLNRGMRLECDPTAIYAALLDHRYRNAIHQSDLASRNPYNTYQHEGLPPGPIASPGIQSLEAAIRPAETNYLYFVAKASGGGHQFSVTLEKHQRATQQYRDASRHASKKARKAG